MTMKLIIRITTAVMLTVSLSQLHAQKVGTTSLQYLKVMPTARATAMGDAYVTLARGADATFWNPAGLTKIEGQEMTSTYTSWIFDTQLLALAYDVPMGNLGNLGVQFQYIDYGTIKETRTETIDLVIGPNGEKVFNPGLTGRSFTPYSYLVGISYAKAITEKFSAGLTLKYATESLWADQVIASVNSVTGEVSNYKTYANVLLFDFGMIYNTGFRSVHIGISVQNFGPQVTFANRSYPAPLAMRVGAAADVVGPDALLLKDEMSRLTVAYDLFQPNDYDQQMHVGAEYSFADAIALRVGYKVGYDSEGLTFGGGVHTALSGVALSFDYSFGKMDEFLNNVHRISLGVQFK
jgi:hypothetical protein